MNRHESRLLAMRVLFIWDFNMLNDISDHNLVYALDPEATDDTNEIQTTLKIIKDDEFSREIVEKVILNKSIIDNFINRHLENYTLDRLSYVDRAIVRVATCEMLFTSNPSQVIINEAVEITKEFSNLDDGSQSKFTNRLLDMMAKTRNEQ